jgi:hypothetical protein
MGFIPILSCACVCCSWSVFRWVLSWFWFSLFTAVCSSRDFGCCRSGFRIPCRSSQPAWVLLVRYQSWHQQPRKAPSQHRFASSLCCREKSAHDSWFHRRSPLRFMPVHPVSVGLSRRCALRLQVSTRPSSVVSGQGFGPISARGTAGLRAALDFLVPSRWSSHGPVWAQVFSAHSFRPGFYSPARDLS